MNIELPLRVSSDFADVISRAQNCRACKEMDGCTRVLSDANGPSDATIMFVGEAPGRLGAERTAIPFHGDVAGENFEKLIALAGLRRSQIFVTNSILCNPTDEKGNNKPPPRSAIQNCSNLLKAQIDAINPTVLVTLGAAALDALRYIEHHEFKLGKDVRTARRWNDRILIPLYHPGARALIHRNFVAQTADYYFVGETLRRSFKGSSNRRSSKRPAREGWDVVKYVLANLQSASLFRVHKILYLLDYKSMESKNHRLTDFFYIRQKDGPYCVELGSKWYRDFDPRLAARFKRKELVFEWLDEGLFRDEVSLGSEKRRLIDELLPSFARFSNGELKTKAYLTKPMKDSLRAERAGLNGLNRALL